MPAYVVREGRESCPVGCGEDIVLVRCLAASRLVGWCWACEVSLPIPLPEGYRLGESDIAPGFYAPGGLLLPDWAEVVTAGLAGQVLRVVPGADWHGVQ